MVERKSDVPKGHPSLLTALGSTRLKSCEASHSSYNHDQNSHPENCSACGPFPYAEEGIGAVDLADIVQIQHQHSVGEGRKARDEWNRGSYHMLLQEDIRADRGHRNEGVNTSISTQIILTIILFLIIILMR